MSPLSEREIYDADTRYLLDEWVHSRKEVWNGLYGLAAACTPQPWRNLLDQSAYRFDQMVESALKVQAVGVDIALRPIQWMPFFAFWSEGARSLLMAAANAQRIPAPAPPDAVAEQERSVVKLDAEFGSAPVLPAESGAPHRGAERRGKNRPFKKSGS
jgi:hypothetical protein